MGATPVMRFALTDQCGAGPNGPRRGPAQNIRLNQPFDAGAVSEV
jgi:hypothetical protein